MDATRLGITFQEAQEVLRNLRNRRRSVGYEPSIKIETNSAGCSSLSASPYFTVPNIFLKSECTKSSYQNPRKSQPVCPAKSTRTPESNSCPRSALPGLSSQEAQAGPRPWSYQSSFVTTDEKRAANPQMTLPKKSWIGKRLEQFKYTKQGQEDNSKLTSLPLTKKSTKFSSVEFSESQLSKTTPAVEHSVRCKLNDSKIHDKIEYPIESSKRPMHAASSQMEITSYLPKVKQSKSNANNIENRSSAVSSNPAAENIQRMSCEEKELVKKKILSASDVACTLLYMDGSSLLRPGAAKSQVKAIYVSFSCSSKPLEECSRVVFPLTENSTEHSRWLREFVSDLMLNENNKVIYNAQKFIRTVIKVLNIENYSGCFRWRCIDPQIASWLLNPDHPPEHFEALVCAGFRKEKLSCKEPSNISGENDRQVDQDMSLMLSLTPHMVLDLQEKKLWELFFTVEMKISPILAVMELLGVEVDTRLLLDYRNILEKKIKKLEQEGYKSVGHSFQMSSTQQVRQVLFNELQLDKNVHKRLARTQIKKYKSTSENVLKHLQDFHPFPKIILEYRTVTKVKWAYVDGILNFVEKNGVLHTNWNQTCAATGRLTSTYPNIQAIPKDQIDITGVAKQFIIGKEMEVTSIIPRKAFRSRAGWSFLSADFQSIELRLLAHFSQDPLLLRIFNESQDDIFVQLASIWLSVDPKSVQKEDRERAKRVVYSVVYGVGKERLADTLNVTADQAKSFTTGFLATFTELKHFIQSCIQECRKQGYVTTIFGRRRPLPGIHSSDPHLRAQSERQAVNFVIQGSAADICKMGMILVLQSIEAQDLKLKARLLIQIHDELLFEVRDDHLENMKELVKVCLEDTNGLCGSHIKLKVDLKISISCGKTWAELQPL